MLPLSSSRRSSRRVLLADDDREVRLGVADLLTGIGLEVLHAETGTEAVELVRLEPLIHAALLDMHMPGYTGVEAIELMRHVRAELPCIVYSGRWSPDLEQTVLAAGARACLKKPVDPDELRYQIRRVLGLIPDLN